MDIIKLIEILQTVLEKEGRLEIVTTGHYGEPFGYSKYDFYTKTVYIDEGIISIKPKRVFNIEHKDIGPVPD